MGTPRSEARALARRLAVTLAWCERLLAAVWADLREAKERGPWVEPWPGEPARGDLARVLRRARLQRAVYGRTPGNEGPERAARRGRG
jgi:hypothetical protein